MFTVERVEDIAGFEKLRDEWNQLLETSSTNCLFLTWEWLFTWWKHLSGRRRLNVLTVRLDGKLIALAPLALRPGQFRRLFPFRVLEFLGTGSVGSDYLNLIVRRGHEREALPALARHLRDGKLMLELSQVERTSRHAIDFALELKQRDWNVSRMTMNFCPYIDLSGHTWASYLASLGRSHRYNFRRRLRNLEKQFEVRFEEVGTEEERRRAIAVLVDLHLKRWHGRGGSDALHTGALIRFHEDASRLALQRGWLRLYVLWLDGQPAAALYGFRYNGTFYFYQSGFEPALGKYSVGLVTMGLAIKSAIEEGAAEYDLLHGDEEYKFLWGRNERELVRLDLFPPRVHGMYYRQAMELRWGVKKIIWRYLPRPLGDRLAPGRRLEVFWRTSRNRRAAQAN